jgi:hypothetical protein
MAAVALLSFISANIQSLGKVTLSPRIVRVFQEAEKFGSG